MENKGGGHYLKKCSCGTIISQCRCMGQKTVTVIKNGCSNCQRKLAVASRCK